MLSPLNIALGLVFITLGMVFYATLAGLAGATVSRMEEMGEGLLIFTITMLVGLYIGVGAASSLLGAGDNPFAMFAMLFPLSSPFLMPGAIVIGKAPLWITVVSLLLLVGLVALLFWFVVINTSPSAILSGLSIPSTSGEIKFASMFSPVFLDIKF